MPVKQLCARAQELCVPTAEWEAARDGMDPKADLELLVHAAMQRPPGENGNARARCFRTMYAKYQSCMV